MKRRRVFSFLAVLCMAVCLAFAFAACGENHTHTFGDWTITVQPTPNVGGKASRVCAEDDFTEEVELPALSDTSVWTKSTTPSTHTVAGKDVYTSEYGKVEVTLPKLEEHTFGEWKFTVTPTKGSGGSAERTCECGQKETKNLPALSDKSFWTVETTPASHTAAGQEVYTSEYGQVTVPIPQQAHTFGSWSITKEPTKTETGTATRTCSENDGGEETKELPDLSDTAFWVKSPESTDATHESDGLEIYTSEYGEVRLTVPRLTEHNYGAWRITKQPTLTEPGKAEHTCTGSDGYIEEQDIPALNDSNTWEKVELECVAPTHETPGHDVYISEYGKVTVELEAQGHSYGPWSFTKEPTLQEAGEATRLCTASDGGKETVDVPALTNQDVWHVSESVAPDYNKAGYDTYSSEYGEVTVPQAKLVAPYDSKTYHSFTVDLNEDFSSRTLHIDAYTLAQLTLNENGMGIGAAFPFQVGDRIEFVMKDAATGEMNIIFTDQSETDGPDEYTGTQKIVTAYLDFETGFILMPYNDNDFTDCYLLTPYGQYETGSAVASVWGKSAADYGIVCTYTYTDGESKTFSFYIENNNVHFNVSFEDLDGQPIAANECHSAPQLFIHDKDGEVIASLGFNGTEVVKLDEFVGKYTVTGEDSKVLLLSGFGTVTYGELSGTYQKAPEGSDYDVLIVVGEAGSQRAYHVKLEGDSCTVSEAPAVVTYNLNGNDEADAIPPASEHEAGVPLELPTPADTDSFVFRGWYLDADCEQPVETPFAPTLDIEIYALWAERVNVTVHVDDSTVEQLALGVGDILGDYLKQFGEGNNLNEEGTKYFGGWYMDAAFDTPIDNDEREVGTDMEGAEIYGRWIDVPSYAGVYHGANLFSTTSTSGQGGESYQIVISYLGVISGKYSGTVTSYSDKLITWQSGTDTKYFYYDEGTGTLATSTYGSANAAADTIITNDMAFYVKNGDRTFNHIGINCPKPDGTSSSSQNCYIRFVEFKVNGEGENRLVLLYNTGIHSDFTVTNSYGEPLTTVDQIKASKTVIVTENGVQLFARASSGADLSSGNTNELDSLYGTYSAAADSSYEKKDTLKLNGAGDLLWGEAACVYTIVDDAQGIIGVTITLEEAPVYFEIALSKDAKTYSVAGPKMVTVTLSDAHGSGYQWTESVNKTIQITLPVTINTEGWLFRGWFTDEECETECQKSGDNYVFTPTAESATIYAKWIAGVKVTVHYNDEGATEDSVIENLGDGETLSLDRPEWAGHKFGGWFTDDQTFAQAWGEMNAQTHVTSAALAAEAPTELTLYAKWEDAPVYSDSYKLYTLTGTSTNGNAEDGKLSSATVKIDGEGEIPGVSAADFPFSNALVVNSYEPDTGKFEILYKSSYSNMTYAGYYDPEHKLIVVAGLTNGSSAFSRDNNVYILASSTTEIVSVKSSYWSSGEVRAITIELAEGEEISVFYKSLTVYYDVTFENYNGDAIDAETAYQQALFYAKKGEEKVGAYGNNGSKMVELDGHEGNYTKQEGSEQDLGEFFLNGAGLMSGSEEKSGTYTEASEGHTIDLYFDGAFYYVTLGDGTYTATKPMATIHLDLGESSDRGGLPESIQANLNIETVIEEPVIAGYMLEGWYSRKEGAALYDKLEKNEEGQWIFTPEEMDITLYANILELFTVHVHYNREGVLEDYDLSVGNGQRLDSASEWRGDPASIVEKQKFLGWFSDETLEEKWDSSFVVQGEMSIYAKWLVLEDVNYTPDESEETTKWVYDEEAGTWTSNNYHEDSSTAKLEILFAVEGTYSFHWFAQGEGRSYDYLRIVHKHADGSSDTTLLSNGGNSAGQEGDLSVEVMPGDTLVLTYTKDGNGNDGADCGRISEIVFVKTVYDDAKGTYHGDKGEEHNQDLILNGKGGATWGGREGSYAVDPKNGNLIKVTLDVSGELPAEYWEVTIDKAESSYTATMPMTTVNFVIDDDTLTHDPVQFNTTIAVALPDVADEANHKYVSGWYVSADHLESVLDAKGLFTPVGESVTVYGKTETMAKLTLNYNGHGPEEGTKDLWFRKGATPDLSSESPEDSSEPKNYFTGWYNEEGCTTTYVPAPMGNDLVVYAGWTENPYTIELTNNSGTEKWILQDDGSYHIDASKAAKAYIQITFKAAGTFKFDWTCMYTDSGEWGDGLIVTINVAPSSAYSGDKKLNAQSGSGTAQEFSVKEGDVLYIASMIYGSASSGDFAQVSNFQFVAG